jgi:hypothetical protein
LGNLTIGNQNAQVTPILASGQIRIVLSWGETPDDLDSHLFGTMNAGTVFHTYYGNEEYYQGEVLMANLDLDDTDSYGPETTTIYHQENGIYKFSVHDYTNGDETNSTALANSGACVRVYIGGSSVKTYYVPNLPGTLWDVFEYNSVTGTFTDLNRMSYEYPESPADMMYSLTGIGGPKEKQKDYQLQ